MEGLELDTGFWSGGLRVSPHVLSLYILKNQKYRCLAFPLIASWFVFLFTLKFDSTISFP